MALWELDAFVSALCHPIYVTLFLTMKSFRDPNSAESLFSSTLVGVKLVLLSGRYGKGGATIFINLFPRNDIIPVSPLSS